MIQFSGANRFRRKRPPPSKSEKKMTDILMPSPMMPMIAEQLAKAGTLHRLWEAADPAAKLAEIAPRIVAFAHEMERVEA